MNIYSLIFNSKKLTFEEKLEKASELAIHKVNVNININLLDIFKDYHFWSQFESCHNKDGKWICENIYYLGDLSGVDFKTDWRFKEVEGKRKELIFKGICCIKGGKINSYKDSSKIINKYLQQDDNMYRFQQWPNQK